MDAIFKDLRLSFRQLLRQPKSSFLIVLCAALAIGLNSSIFTLVNAFTLGTPPGIERAGDMVRLLGTYPGFDYASLSYPNYFDLRASSDVFEELAAYAVRPASLTLAGESERIYGTLVTGNYFAALGVEAARGRAFTAADNEKRLGHPVAVISDRLWHNRLGGAPDVLGRTLLLNGQSFTVVGVTPPEFHGTIPGFAQDIYVPIQMQPLFEPAEAEALDNRNAGWLTTIGRLAPGVSHEQAQAGLDLAVARLKQEYPDANEEWGVAVHRGISLFPPQMERPILASSFLILAVVFCVLLIACANVASLLMARGEARQREISIRLAIGASRGRLLRQLLTESVVLALLGGLAGTLMAWGTARLFPSLMPDLGVPVELAIELDSTVFAYTLGLTLLTGLIFGLAPALQASRPDLVPALKGESGTVGRGRRWPLRRVLVAFQVAVSVLLLAGAGLFVRSLEAESQVDPGFTVENVLLAHFDPAAHGYDEERGRRFYERLVERAAALPGVESVALGQTVPLAIGSQQQWVVEIEGYEPAPGERMNPEYNIVDAGYFQTLEIPVEGRAFRTSDNPDGQPVILVNRAMAERFWNGDALGRRVRLGGEWREVIGIAENSKYLSLRESPQAHMYLPLYQFWRPQSNLHLRTAGDPLALVPALREVVREIDPDLPLYDVRTLEEHTRGALFLPRLGAQMIGAFGLLALVLATVGLIGVLTHAVVRRTREIGIRMSLGAGRGEVFSVLLRDGLELTAWGLVFGLAAALGLGQFLSGLLYGLSGTDLPTFAVAAVVLLLTAVAATSWPAWRATRIDPMTALRHE